MSCLPRSLRRDPQRTLCRLQQHRRVHAILQMQRLLSKERQMKVTADTITDEQLIELGRRNLIDAFTYHMAMWGDCNRVTARERCAKIWNAIVERKYCTCSRGSWSSGFHASYCALVSDNEWREILER